MDGRREQKLSDLSLEEGRWLFLYSYKKSPKKSTCKECLQTNKHTNRRQVV